MEHTIEVQGLHRTYTTTSGLFKRSTKTVQAVKGIDFAVRKGEIFGLLGQNGAGKTTTIKIMSTMLLPTSGSVKVLGYDVVHQTHALRPHINVIFGGERNLYWRLTGRQNLQYFCDLYKLPVQVARPRIEELLEAVSLTEAADRRVETYSKGMKQRLQIARGLINNPEVLFLDEPTIGLDPVAAYELRRLVARLAEQGTTVVLTTHYMFEAEQLCNRIAIVDKGKIVALDTPANLKRLAVGLSVVEATAVDVSSDDLQRLRNIPDVWQMESSPLGHKLILQFQTEAPEAVATGIRQVLNPGQLLDLKVREATLEDAYLRLVGGTTR